MPPPTVAHADPELARLEALKRYGILDTPQERAFDAIVEEAARELGYPSAMLTFMDAERCWLKATTGVEPRDAHVREIPRRQTICNHALGTSGILVVRDAREDARFARLPIVDRPNGYRAYVAAQIITPDGHTIGTLCALDVEPREPTADQRRILRRLAERALNLVEDRRRDLAPAASVALSPPTAAMAGGSQSLVLIVDDEELIRTMMAAMITRLGREVRLAENGRAALECIAAEGGRVRLVLTDIHMPVMGGVELVEKLRLQPNAPSVIAVSGKFTDEIRAQLRAAGVTTMFGKPFTMSDIARAIEQALPAVR